MDDRTLIICAATLCVMGPLTQLLEANGWRPGAAQVASAGSSMNTSMNTSSSISVSRLSGHAVEALSGTRLLLSGQ